MTALQHRTPLVGVPDFADQRDIAARIVDHRVGVALEKPASADALANAVARVLNEPEFTEAAARLARKLATDNGPEDAAAELERVAAG
jgi:UDP:flavonoid glycosyltransferase YjiC (YdhE family)